MTTNTSNPLGEVHSLTCRMGDLARTIMRLHPDSPSRAASIKEYEESRAKAKATRDSITDNDDRKTATWLIRTAGKPVDNTGRPIA
jgi:hypothetical protein